MRRLIRTPIFPAISILLVFGCFNQAEAVSSQLWLQSTEATRFGATELQDQINSARATQQAKQAQEELLRQRTLELLTIQQKALLQNLQKNAEPAANEVPEFKPLPQISTKSNNPWLKKNPWGNTQHNPYSGEQYKSNTTQVPGSGGIYVKPDDNATEAAQPSKSVNIFK